MVPTSPLILMWIKTRRCLIFMKDPLIIHETSQDAEFGDFKNGYTTL